MNYRPPLFQAAFKRIFLPKAAFFSFSQKIFSKRSSPTCSEKRFALHFGANLTYEQNPKVRKLIKKDIEFLDNVQVEMATARQFLFTARIKASKDKQVFDTANRVEKIISEQGFEVRRMRKADIKRFLALYFEASMNGEQMPDIDGEQFYEVDEDEEDEA